MKILGKIVVSSFLITTILLVGGVFGVSIATASLTKEFTIDPTNGFAIVPTTGKILKTALAVKHDRDVFLLDMDNEALGYVQAIILEEADIRLLIFGHARDSTNNVLTMIVQGGTLSFDKSGLKSATGDPAILLEEAGMLETGHRILETNGSNGRAAMMGRSLSSSGISIVTMPPLIIGLVPDDLKELSF